ncbi:Rho GTPase-activating protein 2 [Castilleja foliolosa]|uniref:Rho GTPase-activating protein 2 n=1 Tax=Castilleja foliolosa TaxID=1961234 RepID=A0ABD3BX86_9LAMI
MEVEIPCQAPSASESVCGVSANSMQWSYDTRCNSVPNILLLMQERLYALGGLKAEGIFRINPDNSKEEFVRDQLNRGIVPDNIDVHRLAGLIKAWFRELPCGVLDGLSPEQVLQCGTEEEFVKLIKELKPTESCLLGWAIDLMADVVEHEESNKMNARNIAIVFAPNMSQRAFEAYHVVQGLRSNTLSKPKWVFPKCCNDDVGDADCGLFVMRHMLEIIKLDVCNSFEKVLSMEEPYSSDDIDDVRKRWAECFLEVI